jgi:hypothetical protein
VSGVPASFTLCALLADLKLETKDFENVKYKSQLYGGIRQLCVVNDIISFLKESLETLKDTTENISSQKEPKDLHLNFIINRAQVLAQDPHVANPLQLAINEAFSIANQELWNFVSYLENSSMSEKLKEYCFLILKCLFDNIEWSLLNPRYKHVKPVINGKKTSLPLEILYEYHTEPLKPITRQGVNIKPQVYFGPLKKGEEQMDVQPEARKVTLT